MTLRASGRISAARPLQTLADRGSIDVTRGGAQAWADALRNPGVHAVTGSAYRTIRGYFAEVARRARAAGRSTTMPTSSRPPPRCSPSSTVSCSQRLLLDDGPVPEYGTAVHALLT